MKDLSSDGRHYVHYFEQMRSDGQIVHFSYDATLKHQTHIVGNDTTIVGIKVFP